MLEGQIWESQVKVHTEYIWLFYKGRRLLCFCDRVLGEPGSLVVSKPDLQPLVSLSGQQGCLIPDPKLLIFCTWASTLKWAW